MDLKGNVIVIVKGNQYKVKGNQYKVKGIQTSPSFQRRFNFQINFFRRKNQPLKKIDHIGKFKIIRRIHF